jgi:hypothetical protein
MDSEYYVACLRLSISEKRRRRYGFKGSTNNLHGITGLEEFEKEFFQKLSIKR